MTDAQFDNAFKGRFKNGDLIEIEYEHDPEVGYVTRTVVYWIGGTFIPSEGSAIYEKQSMIMSTSGEFFVASKTKSIKLASGI